MRRRGSGAKAARAPVAVPTRKHCSGVSAIAVMGPWLTSYVSTTCVSAQLCHGVLPFAAHMAMQAGSQQLRTSNQGRAQMGQAFRLAKASHIWVHVACWLHLRSGKWEQLPPTCRECSQRSRTLPLEPPVSRKRPSAVTAAAASRSVPSAATSSLPLI